jgi:hypothetical protein
MQRREVLAGFQGCIRVRVSGDHNGLSMLTILFIW